MNDASVRDPRTSVVKAMSVLKAFGKDANVGLGVSELARRAELSKSTAYRLLEMLETSGVVERRGTAYRIGRELHELTRPAPNPVDDLARDLLTPFLAELYEATHHTVQLAVLHGPHVVYLNKLEGHQRLRSPSRIGGRMPAYSTGVGKALLAHNPNAVEATLARPRHAWTPTTLVGAEALLDELAQVRVNGVANDAGESYESLFCIAAPIMGPDGVVAAMSVSDDKQLHPNTYEPVLRRICREASLTLNRALADSNPGATARSVPRKVS